MRHSTMLAFLIAIAVALAVIGVAYPNSIRIKERSNRLLCLENLRRIGEGIREWSLTHDSLLPPGRGMSGYADSPDGSPLPGNIYAVEPGLNALWDKGNGVIKDPSVFVCPGDRWAEPPPKPGEDFTSPGQLSYGMTGYIYPTDPGNKVIVADKSDPTKPDHATAGSRNHGNHYINVLFLDGQVKTVTSPFLPAGEGSDPGSIYRMDSKSANDTFIK